MPTKTLAVRVGPATYGQGVYACRSFRRGEKIARIEGDVIFDETAGSEYAIDLSDGRLLEPWEPFRYLNHSCEPNCELLNFTADDADKTEYEVRLKAIKAIAEGEQLTIDYAWSADAAIPCGCKTATCRGWIVSPEQLHIVHKKLKRKAK
jgi:hypothetical protein